MVLINIYAIIMIFFPIENNTNIIILIFRLSKTTFCKGLDLFLFEILFCINFTTVKPEHRESHFVTHNIKIQLKFYTNKQEFFIRNESIWFKPLIWVFWLNFAILLQPHQFISVYNSVLCVTLSLLSVLTAFLNELLILFHAFAETCFVLHSH